MLKKISSIVVMLLLILSVVLNLSACGKKNDQLAAPKKGDTVAILHTSMGDIKVKFFEKQAPKTVENFLTLSKEGYYDGVIFHRVMEDFMIQGGDPTGLGTGGESCWGGEFEDEFSPELHNFRGALSMAIIGKANTNGSQFFIVQADSVDKGYIDAMPSADKAFGFTKDVIETYKKQGGTPWLDQHHTVFGQDYEGMDVVDAIAKVETDSNDRPVEEVKILSVEVTTYGE